MTDEQLNTLLAEKVMGWTVCPGPHVVDWWRDDSGDFIPCYQFKPTTEIESAWLVVEKMSNWAFTLTRERILSAVNGPIDGYYAVIGGSGKWARTAPRAICFAALAAKDVEVPAE